MTGSNDSGVLIVSYSAATCLHALRAVLLDLVSYLVSSHVSDWSLRSVRLRRQELRWLEHPASERQNILAKLPSRCVVLSVLTHCYVAAAVNQRHDVRQ